jgi:hypothetical protein
MSRVPGTGHVIDDLIDSHPDDLIDSHPNEA